jgi:hypothetical protein
MDNGYTPQGAGELSTNRRLISNKRDICPISQRPGCRDRNFRSSIATHGVDGNSRPISWQSAALHRFRASDKDRGSQIRRRCQQPPGPVRGGLSVFTLDDFSTSIVAVGGHMMTTMGFPGHRINGQSRLGQSIMRSAIAAPGTGGFILLNCHRASNS